MDIRRLIAGLLLASASLLLTSCAPEQSNCKNLIGSKCIPVEPGGSFSATPNPVSEGTTVRFNFDISDPSPKDSVTCVFDPEGDGTFQLNVSCEGIQDYVYQVAGVYNATVKATDTQDVTITLVLPVTVNEGPTGIPATQLQLLDAGRNAVTGVSGCVIPSGETVCNPAFSITESGGGLYTVAPALPQDTPASNPFKLQLTQGDDGTPVVVTVDVQVDNDNLQGLITMITPFDCSSSVLNCTNVNDPTPAGIIATLAGIITSASTGLPVPNAQVSISGGAATGGAYSTVFTNANGEYTLLVNVGTNLTSAIASSTFRIYADGFAEVAAQFPVSARHFYGLNFAIQTAAPTSRLFSESFEADSPTVAAWVATGGLDLGADDQDVRWQLVNDGDNIVNNLVPDCSNLAPGDISAAALPDPIQGLRAFWYGQKQTGSFNGSDPGECEGASSTGALTSPAIGLGGVPDPVRLTFKTYWDIESVNPNAGGFDLMTILMSVDDGATFERVGRLNPLSDPAGISNRAPIPYSSTGFNSPPLWVQQESIALPNAGGKTIILRFEFDTNDGLFNDFRGWMIDDIAIERGQGSLN